MKVNFVHSTRVGKSHCENIHVFLQVYRCIYDIVSQLFGVREFHTDTFVLCCEGVLLFPILCLKVLLYSYYFVLYPYNLIGVAFILFKVFFNKKRKWIYIDIVCRQFGDIVSSHQTDILQLNIITKDLGTVFYLVLFSTFVTDYFFSHILGFYIIFGIISFTYMSHHTNAFGGTSTVCDFFCIGSHCIIVMFLTIHKNTPLYMFYIVFIVVALLSTYFNDAINYIEIQESCCLNSAIFLKQSVIVKLVA